MWLQQWFSLNFQMKPSVTEHKDCLVTWFDYHAHCSENLE